MDCTTIRIIASNDTGNGQDVPLAATIDDNVEESMLTSKYWNTIEGDLESPRTKPLPFEKKLSDSQGISYTARNTVNLVIRRHGELDKCRTYNVQIYITESENTRFGRHEILLPKSWKAKFARPDNDGTKTYPAAPTVLQKGRGKERKEWEEKASENDKQNLAAAQDTESQFTKWKAEQSQLNKGLSSA